MGQSADDIAPIPPRYRWTRRIAKGLLVTFILLFIVRIAWGWEAHRRLNAAIRECRSPSRPLLPEDFAQPPLPDDRNAASILKKTIIGYTPLSEWRRAPLADLLDEPSFTQGIIRMWSAERQLYLELFRALKDGRIGREIDPERDEVKPPTALDRIVIRA